MLFYFGTGSFQIFLRPSKTLELEEVDLGNEFSRTIDFTIAFIVVVLIHHLIDSCGMNILTRLRQQSISIKNDHPIINYTYL
jgi:hypothetical protein